MKKRKRRFVTSFLFSSPSFLTGAGTVINLAGNYYQYNTSRSDLEADSLAIACDFGVVGEDIRQAMDEIAEEEELGVAG